LYTFLKHLQNRLFSPILDCHFALKDPLKDSP
jgi:hypothetical protein